MQMGSFAIAHQLRNMVALLPGLLLQSSYALMAAGEDADEQAPDHVMAACTGPLHLRRYWPRGLGIMGLHWGLPLLYGHSYAGAEAAAFALATAVVTWEMHPPAHACRFFLSCYRVINSVWAVTVALSATLLLFHGSALLGAAIYLGAQLVYATLIFVSLQKRGHLPREPRCSSLSQPEPACFYQFWR